MTPDRRGVPDPASGCLLVEAEAFDDHGSWTMDSQFEPAVGSPYLLAHGLGRPVADASTMVDVAVPGDDTVWARTKDWVPSHHPGRFTLAVDGATLGGELGAHGRDGSWEPVGSRRLDAGPTRLALHDLTGFDGRCDAIFLGRDGAAPPDEATRAWRKEMLGLPELPHDAGEFDVVVVGGVTGSTCAVAAARLGASRTARHPVECTTSTSPS